MSVEPTIEQEIADGINRGIERLDTPIPLTHQGMQLLRSYTIGGLRMFVRAVCVERWGERGEAIAEDLLRDLV